jgi:molecular chaperone HtpG
MVDGIDRICRRTHFNRPEAHLSTGLMTWALQHGKIDLCGRLRLKRDPNGREFELQSRDVIEVWSRVYFAGNDTSIPEAHASEDTRCSLLRTRTPRRTVEQRYLGEFCDSDEISGQPQVLRLREEESVAEGAFRYRVSSILEGDYFVRIEVRLGDISHGLPVIVEGTGAQSKLVISPTAGCNSAVIALYDSDWAAFGSMVKDYVRSIVFPKIQSLVPSARRDGALAFLNRSRDPRVLSTSDRTCRASTRSGLNMPRGTCHLKGREPFAASSTGEHSGVRPRLRTTRPGRHRRRSRERGSHGIGRST